MQPNEQVLVAISALKIADRNQWTDENFPSVSCAIGNRENGPTAPHCPYRASSERSARLIRKTNDPRSQTTIIPIGLVALRFRSVQ